MDCQHTFKMVNSYSIWGHVFGDFLNFLMLMGSRYWRFFLGFPNHLSNSFFSADYLLRTSYLLGICRIPDLTG